MRVQERKGRRVAGGGGGEFSPLFILGEVPESQIPEHMKEYKIATGRKTISQSKKLLGVLRAKKILLYSPLLKWYLNHGLLVTKIYKRYRNALEGSIDRASNKGFRLKGQSIVSYQQDKLGLSAYYDKRIVHKDGILTGPLGV